MREACYYRGFQEAGTSAIARSFALVQQGNTGGSSSSSSSAVSQKTESEAARITTNRPIQARGAPAAGTAEHKLCYQRRRLPFPSIRSDRRKGSGRVSAGRSAADDSADRPGGATVHFGPPRLLRPICIRRRETGTRKGKRSRTRERTRTLPSTRLLRKAGKKTARRQQRGRERGRSALGFAETHHGARRNDVRRLGCADAFLEPGVKGLARGNE